MIQELLGYATSDFIRQVYQVTYDEMRAAAAKIMDEAIYEKGGGEPTDSNDSGNSEDDNE